MLPALPAEMPIGSCFLHDWGGARRSRAFHGNGLRECTRLRFGQDVHPRANRDPREDAAAVVGLFGHERGGFISTSGTQDDEHRLGSAVEIGQRSAEVDLRFARVKKRQMIAPYLVVIFPSRWWASHTLLAPVARSM